MQNIQLQFPFYLKCILIVLLGLLMSCEPEIIIKKVYRDRECVAKNPIIYYPGEMLYGRVAGLKNCVPFQASAVASIENGNEEVIKISITTTESPENKSSIRESLNIELNGILSDWVSLIDSAYQIDKSMYVIKPNDSLIDSFRFDSEYEFNEITITKVDLSGMTIQGWFEARFILEQSSSSGMSPDTVIFWDCHFISKVLN